MKPFQAVQAAVFEAFGAIFGLYALLMKQVRLPQKENLMSGEKKSKRHRAHSGSIKGQKSLIARRMKSISGITNGEAIIYVSNIPLTFSEGDMVDIAMKYGTVLMIKMGFAPESEKHEYCAKIEYKEIGEAYTAFVAFNQMDLDGHETSAQFLSQNHLLDRASRAIMIENIDQDVDFNDVIKIFSRYGDVVRTNLTDHITKYGVYLQYAEFDSATNAVRAMNRQCIGSCEDPILVCYTKEQLNRLKKSFSVTPQNYFNKDLLLQC